MSRGPLDRASRPAIAIADLAALVSRYPQLGRFVGIQANGLSANAPACLFTTERGIFFAKGLAVAPGEAREAETAHAIANHARAQGFPTPRALAGANGRTIAWQAGQAFVLFEPATGEDRYGDAPVFAPFESAGEATAAGASLARFHRAVADFPPPAPRGLGGLVARCEAPLAPDPRAHLASTLWADSPALQAFLAARNVTFAPALERMTRAAQPLQALASALPRGIIHGDYIKRNLFWQGALVSDVIDLDLWNVGPWAFDLALALLPCGFNWPELLADPARAPNQTHLRAMRDGYERERPLAPAERMALAPLVETARFEFYQSGIALALARGDGALAERFFALLCDTSAWFAAHPGWQAGAFGGQN